MGTQIDDIRFHRRRTDWEENIKERNNKIENGENVTVFYVTDGLKKKIIENWETSNKEDKIAETKKTYRRNKWNENQKIKYLC